MDAKSNRLINEIKQNIQQMKNIKDPYKQDVVYLKKLIGEYFITEVAKVTEKGTLEFYAGGSAEVIDESKEVSLLNLHKRGFIPCEKEEYDRTAQKAVSEINALV